jgi:hypothetical protein
LENKHVRNIGSSRQLRYLRIESPKITELPGEIGKLRYLETLDLRYCTALLRLPSTVVQLLKLVRLFVSIYTVLPAVEFGSMDALEEVNFRNTDDPMRFAEELRHLTKLRKLRRLGHHIEDPIRDYAIREKILELLVSSVSELAKCNLKYLGTDGKIGQRLFRDLCCSYPYLHGLAIYPHIEMIPKGMASLRNLVKLKIAVKEFDKEGLHVLMDMRSLSHLWLHIINAMKENLTIDNNGFKVLKVFLFRYRISSSFEVEPTNLLQLTFAPGAVPALRSLVLLFSPMEVTFDFFTNLGFQHFSGLAHFDATLWCDGAAPGRVEALESSIEKAIDLYPSCEFQVSRFLEDGMFKDDKQWEEAVAERRKEFEEHRQKLEESREEEMRLATTN